MFVECALFLFRDLPDPRPVDPRLKLSEQKFWFEVPYFCVGPKGGGWRSPPRKWGQCKRFAPKIMVKHQVCGASALLKLENLRKSCHPDPPDPKTKFFHKIHNRTLECPYRTPIEAGHAGDCSFLRWDVWIRKGSGAWVGPVMACASPRDRAETSTPFGCDVGNLASKTEY